MSVTRVSEPVRDVAMLVCVALLLGGCVNLPDMPEVSGLPASAAQALEGGDYPDLRAIPAMPTGRPDAARWARQQAALQASGDQLNGDPRAGLRASIPEAESWAGPLRASMLAEPKLAPPPAWMADDAWLRATLARMQAGPARP